MNKISVILFIASVFFCPVEVTYAQSFDWPKSTINEQKDSINNIVQVFLDDTNYYTSRDYIFNDSAKYYMQYFMSTGALEYELRDSLPDGCYVLIALTRKDAKKLPDHLLNRYVAATGCFENGMKQGRFTFSTTLRLPSEMGKLPENKPEYKSIVFLNDTVNGNVQEYYSTALYHLAQYQKGVLNGYYIMASSTTTLIKLYQDGILIKEVVVE